MRDAENDTRFTSTNVESKWTLPLFERSTERSHVPSVALDIVNERPDVDPGVASRLDGSITAEMAGVDVATQFGMTVSVPAKGTAVTRNVPSVLRSNDATLAASIV